MTELEKAEHYRVETSLSEHAPGRWTVAAEIFFKTVPADDARVISRMMKSDFTTKDDAEAAALGWARKEINEFD